MSKRKSIIDYEFEPKKVKFACESCDQEFKSDASLLRHVSHKLACNEHYGEERLWEMRRSGKLLAGKKWKRANRPHDKIEYMKNKCTTKSTCNSSADKNYPKFSYVSEGVRKCTYAGVAFRKYFRIIYQKKKQDTLDSLKEFARQKVYNNCVDFTLDKVFTEQKTYTIDYDDHGDLEKALEAAFEDRIERKIAQDVNEWIDNASIHLSITCQKQSENFVFNNFLAEFRSAIFPELQEKVLDLTFNFTDEDINNIKIEETDRKDRIDRRIYEFFFWRYVRLLDEELSQEPKETSIGIKLDELGNKIGDKISDLIYKQVKFLKNVDD